MYNIAVIGAGVIGLSTALNIQKTITNAKVRIIADKFVTKTTSYGAAGIFLPLYSSFPDTPRDKLRSWYTDSWKFYSSLALSSEADGSGFMVCPGYVPCNTRNEENHLYKDIVFSYKEMTQSEMEKLNINGFKYCYQVTTVITTCSVYLSWLLERFKENGGEVEQRTIYNIQEFVGKYDVIVNCSGFGSRELFNDKSLYSIRGQIAKVVAPWIKTWYYPDDGSYIIVNRDRVILGGTKQAYNENKDIVETDSKKIMEGCIRVVPALKGYKLDQEWVGLRPGRSTVRLEKEIIPRQNGTLKIVHNYGHGSSGVSLSWGTGMEAAKLVKEVLSVQQQSRL